MNPVKKLLVIVSIFSFIYFIATGFDIFPFLRGPGDWQWSYLFVNTFPKIFPSLIIISIILYFFRFLDKKNEQKIKKYEKIFLPMAVLLAFLFQLSVVYFSRGGIFVLLARTITPEANGYFTASLGIHSLFDFLANYNNLVSHFPMHAHGHPPGAIILSYIINNFFILSQPINSFVNTLSPSTKPILDIWLNLLPNQKIGALFLSFLVPLFSSLIIIPLYYAFKLYENTRIALRGIFLYIFIPSVTLFTPIPDVFFSAFPIIGFFFLILAQKKNNLWYLFLCGLILSIGIFFSLSILPFILMFLIVIFILNLKTKKRFIALINKVGYFFTGIFLPFVLLYFLYGFNFIAVSNTVLSITLETISHRSYLVWVFYNFYGFLIFAGIPTFIFFIYAIKNNFNKIKDNYLFISFIITLLILDISGNVKGETERLWISFIPFLILIVISFLNREYNFKTRDYLIIYLIQAIQILVMQEFLVLLW
jgi:hypothetical protein